MDSLYCFCAEQFLSLVAGHSLTATTYLTQKFSVCNFCMNHIEITACNSALGYCIQICCLGNVFIKPLPHNGQSKHVIIIIVMNVRKVYKSSGQKPRILEFYRRSSQNILCVGNFHLYCCPTQCGRMWYIKLYCALHIIADCNNVLLSFLCHLCIQNSSYLAVCSSYVSLALWWCVNIMYRPGKNNNNDFNPRSLRPCI
jgi:hypothetical protein